MILVNSILFFTLDYDRNLFAGPLCIDMQMHNIQLSMCKLLSCGLKVIEETFQSLVVIWLHVTSLIYKAAYEFVKTSLYFIYLVIKNSQWVIWGLKSVFALFNCHASITFLLYILLEQENFVHHYFLRNQNN